MRLCSVDAGTAMRKFGVFDPVPATPGGCGAIVFTGGASEKSPALGPRVMEGLEFRRAGRLRLTP